MQRVFIGMMGNMLASGQIPASKCFNLQKICAQIMRCVGSRFRTLGESCGRVVLRTCGRSLNTEGYYLNDAAAVEANRNHASQNQPRARDLQQGDIFIEKYM